MSRNIYSNFVKPSSSGEVSGSTNSFAQTRISGEEARKIYINEVKHVKDPVPVKRKKLVVDQEISDKDLFISVQNDDIDTLKAALDNDPDKINKLDDYGWSLLMIACQANSIDSVKELLKRSCNTSVRDKAGNSAQSLVIKNKNYILADILLSHTQTQREKEVKNKEQTSHHNDDVRIEDFFCDLCNIKVRNKDYHLSSTIHNINLSKGKKMPTNYVIPESNRGYQIMLKVGWDKESGLGPDGSGKKYPIKTVLKQDRKGLGHGKKTNKVEKTEKTSESVRQKNRKALARDHESNRRMEINFRRQFYLN
ncbi:G patch domain and ankyrin repeat-containing protein 1 homolog [Ostrinia nubilalis]|uniref:G patch domain and ankyrin repeat-containing protein 1 homolog n=1 Tax=Ostrinia nubilalis TaxID=29057 RepID=UPI003082474D